MASVFTKSTAGANSFSFALSFPYAVSWNTTFEPVPWGVMEIDHVTVTSRSFRGPKGASKIKLLLGSNEVTVPCRTSPASHFSSHFPPTSNVRDKF